jgi:hypothetical protein
MLENRSHVENWGRATDEGAGRDGYPYGSTSQEGGKPVVSFAYRTRDAAEAAATQVRAAIEHAIEVRTHHQPEGEWGRGRWR